MYRRPDHADSILSPTGAMSRAVSRSYIVYIFIDLCPPAWVCI